MANSHQSGLLPGAGSICLDRLTGSEVAPEFLREKLLVAA
jgi:hypothetical protein